MIFEVGKDFSMLPILYAGLRQGPDGGGALVAGGTGDSGGAIGDVLLDIGSMEGCMSKPGTGGLLVAGSVAAETAGSGVVGGAGGTGAGAAMVIFFTSAALQISRTAANLS